MYSLLSFIKIEKTVKPQHFVQWRRRLIAVISGDDPTLLSILDDLRAKATKHIEWVSANSKSKQTIILSLGDSALAKKGDLVDGNGTA